MKTSILVLVLSIFTISVDAQSKNSLVFGDVLLKYKNMERTGTIIIVVGGVALFTGNILYWKSYNNHSNTDPSENKAKTYGYVMLGGLGLMAVGIPILTVGKLKERRITIEAQLVKFKGLASVNGLGLKIKF